MLNTCFFLFSFFFLLFFGGVALSEYFYTITVFSLYGEYVLIFPLPGGVFLPCDHGLDFVISLCQNSINQSINSQKLTFSCGASCSGCLHAPRLASLPGAGAGTGARALLSASSIGGTSGTSAFPCTLSIGSVMSVLSGR